MDSCAVRTAQLHIKVPATRQVLSEAIQGCSDGSFLCIPDEKISTGKSSR